jgi:excisionase family DNA binding protein
MKSSADSAEYLELNYFAVKITGGEAIRWYRTRMDKTIRLLTSQEVCLFLGIHQETLYLWLKDGRIPYRRVGRQYRFMQSELDSWLAERTV